MNILICSLRVRSCTSISGTVSGTGTGTSAASIDDGAVSTSAGAGGAVADAAAGAVVAAGEVDVVVTTGAGASFENFSKMKSNWCSGAAGWNFTLAWIVAGNA